MTEHLGRPGVHVLAYGPGNPLVDGMGGKGNGEVVAPAVVLLERGGAQRRQQGTATAVGGDTGHRVEVRRRCRAVEDRRGEHDEPILLREAHQPSGDQLGEARRGAGVIEVTSGVPVALSVGVL